MDDLVSTEWLAAGMGAPDLKVLDASAHLPATGRNARADFERAHLPGALFLDLGSLADSESAVPAALPTADQFAQRIGELGMDRTDRIVLYDDSATRSSARAWFMFRMNGFERVAILDGGLGKWVREGRHVESGSAAEQSRTRPEAQQDTSRVRTKANMLANLDQPSEQVLDARDAGRFTGEVEDTVHGLPGGHIPGARNLHFAQLFAQDGTWRGPAEIREAFADAGIDLDRPVTTTCGSGVTASVLLFAMHLIGKEDTALYDGSWSEWGADPATPKETGASR